MRNTLRKLEERLTNNQPPDFRTFALTLEEARARGSAKPGPLERHFLESRGRLAHKWLHYLPIYDRVLAPWHGKPVRFLELGVAMGGSLEMWRSYFGEDGTIFGVDINPDCAERFDEPNQVRIGSQADPDFLAGVLAEMGPPDIILDDGSHVASHQRASFEALWPSLAVGGLYIIEDMQTAYWPAFEGGYRKPGTAVEMVKQLIDDLHGFHHGRGEALALKQEIGSIQVFDSIAVIEKFERIRPGHVKTGDGVE